MNGIGCTFRAALRDRHSKSIPWDNNFSIVTFTHGYESMREVSFCCESPRFFLHHQSLFGLWSCIGNFSSSATSRLVILLQFSPLPRSRHSTSVKQQKVLKNKRKRTRMKRGIKVSAINTWHHTLFVPVYSHSMNSQRKRKVTAFRSTPHPGDSCVLHIVVKNLNPLSQYFVIL
jgi:hypothetical protein